MKSIRTVVGLALCLALSWPAVAEKSASPAPSEKFTVAVIPDTQNYADHRYQKKSTPAWPINQQDIMARQFDWIAKRSRARGGDIVFATHVGDLWQDYGAEEARSVQIPIVTKAFDILAKTLPFSVVPGNHDYDSSWTDEKEKSARVDGGATYNAVFGGASPYFAGKDWFGGSYDNGMNSYQTFVGGGYRFLHIGLELEPSDAAIAWAQTVIDAHPDSPVIITTHEYLGWDDEKDGSGKAVRLADSYRKGFNRNSPQALWEKLIAPNPQVFLVLCGHNYSGPNGENSRVDLDDDGLPVYQFLSDYQGRTELWQANAEIAKIKASLATGEPSPYKGIADNDRGGDGWLRLLEFDPSAQSIHVRTYSTELKRYETDEDSDFVVGFDWSARFGALARIRGSAEPRVQFREDPKSAWVVDFDRAARRAKVYHKDHPEYVFDVDCDDQKDDKHYAGLSPQINGISGDVQFFFTTAPMIYPMLDYIAQPLELVRLEQYFAERSESENEGDYFRVRFEGGGYNILRPVGGGDGDKLYTEIALQFTKESLIMYAYGLYYILPSDKGTQITLTSRGQPVVRTIDASSKASLDYYDDVTGIAVKDAKLGDYDIATYMNRVQIEVHNKKGTDGFEIDLDHTFKDRAQKHVMSKITFPLASPSAASAGATPAAK